jgi:sister chromatid cohesion protein PDS5
MLDVLCPLITESDTVSNELLDIILINIVEPQKTQRKNAYYIAKELISKTTDTLEPYIQAVSLHFIFFLLKCHRMMVDRIFFTVVQSNAAFG